MFSTLFRRRPRRLVVATALGVACGLVAACPDPLEQCQGQIEVSCDADGCWCATGAHEGASCIDEQNSNDPSVCENLCCGAAQGTPGPPSILRGNK